jgi:hypothetical protein
MSDGGKGSGRRPGNIDADKWRSVFGESPLERKVRLEKENMMNTQPEYDDVIIAEDALMAFYVNSK